MFCADYYRTGLACRKRGQRIDAVLRQENPLIVGAHEVGMPWGLPWQQLRP